MWQTAHPHCLTLLTDINFLLIEELGLSHTIERISVNMMGCFGGLTTLKTARALAQQSSKNRVLMVCTELSSLHFKPTLDIDTMLACALFSDGSAAMVVGTEPQPSETPIYELLATGAHHIPETKALMRWVSPWQL